MENSTEETAEYAPLLDQRYLVLIGQRKVADAEEYISEQLRVCVDEGEIHALADLYAHRAVWRMQLGKLRAAAKDLQAALKARISGQAVVEVRALLAQCYRDTGRPDEAAEEEKQALKDAVTGSHLPVLAVKQLLSESKAKATREESTTEMVSAKPQQNSAGAASASNGSTATEVPSRKQRQRGSMGGGFLTKADTLTTANSVSSGPCTSGDLARPVGRTQRAGVIPEGAGRRVEDVDDEEPLAAARPRRGGATITDLDGDELEEVINTPLNLTTDPAAKTRLMALMGPGRYASGHEYLLYNERSQIIANCITQINAGNFRQPDADLTALLEEEPECYQALVARGTCRALAGSTKNSELRKAEADFTKAIKILPDLADVWKRRSQARAALGDFAGATKDLHDCLRQCASLY